MDAILRPLENVNESLSWFLAAREQRVLYIQAAEALRAPILQRLSQLEGQRRCPSPVLMIEAGDEPEQDEGKGRGDVAGDDGWATRTEELVEEMAAARERASAAEPPLEVRVLVPPPPFSPAAAGFARTLRVALDCVRPPLDGLLVVLAPVWINDGAGWSRTLQALLSAPELAAARFVVVDPEDGPARELAVALGTRAEVVDGRIDGKAGAAALSAMVAGMASAPPGAGAARAAGLAGPREAPPPRRGAPAPAPAQQAAALSELGLPPAYGDVDLMQRIRVAVMSAAREIADGHAPEAVRLQRQARDLAAGAGLTREAALFEIVAGSYALQGGSIQAALAAFEAAAARASAAGLFELAAQAHLARGGALLVQSRPADAAIAYAEAGRLAAVKLPAVAIEGYRMAGTLLVSLRQEMHAIEVWRRALDIAGALPPADGAATTAPEVARAMAQVCRQRRMFAQATALEEQAAAMEHPPPANAARAEAAPPVVASPGDGGEGRR